MKQLRLFSLPPTRKIVERTEGAGFDIAVAQPGSGAFERLRAVYATRGEAAEALRNGVGRTKQVRAETMSLYVVKGAKGKEAPV